MFRYRMKGAVRQGGESKKERPQAQNAMEPPCRELPFSSFFWPGLMRLDGVRRGLRLPRRDSSGLRFRPPGAELLHLGNE
jgi:hypothetical protein